MVEKESYCYSDINIVAFSIDNDMNIFPYGVINSLYHFNSDYPFLIIILNTTKLYTFPNYRYEYIVSSDANLFKLSDDFVQAILFYVLKTQYLHHR